MLQGCQWKCAADGCRHAFQRCVLTGLLRHVSPPAWEARVLLCLLRSHARAAGAQEELLLSVVVATAICTLLLSLLPERSQDYAVRPAAPAGPCGTTRCSALSDALRSRLHNALLHA